jgi:hypothetical protein
MGTGERRVTDSSTVGDVYGADIFTEPPGDPDTIANLGPLRLMAGTFEGAKGSDDHPIAGGSENNTFVEHYELEPIDFQTNGPQLFYGLRYHTHILRPGDPETFHDQIGYFLWEPAAHAVTFTLAIPRGQVLLAAGSAEPDATEFELTAAIGSEIYGILSNPFLDRAFRTLSYRMHVSVESDASWSYEEEALLEIPGRDEPFRHADHNTLYRVGDAVPNPLIGRLAASPGKADTSLGIGNLRDESGNLL